MTKFEILIMLSLVISKDFCTKQNWRCTFRGNVYGSEASVTILYDFDDFAYERFTRAKTQLVIVTIDGKQWYFL